MQKSSDHNKRNAKLYEHVCQDRVMLNGKKVVKICIYFIVDLIYSRFNVFMQNVSLL
jgi:hypothetical protein